MTFPKPEIVDCGEVRLATYQRGSGPPVILCHGFPELAYSWRFQLPALAEAGYRAIAPDLRGYGRSDRPAAVSDYHEDQLVGDLLGLLKAIDNKQAIFVGHDWGALLLWQFALRHPEHVAALINLNIPFYPRPPSDPLEYMREVLGPSHYIVDFCDSEAADRAFNADPERFLQSVMRRLPVRRNQLSVDAMQPRAYSMRAGLRASRWPGEPLLSATELAEFVAGFSQSGFSGPINWYRNWSANWRSSAGREQQLNVPTLFIGANDDVLVQPKHVEDMRAYISDIEIHWIFECGHWTQQEHPDAVNALIIDWLQRRGFAP